MVPPGLEVVMRQDPTHRLGGGALDEPLAFQLAGQLDAVPLREGAPEAIGPLTGPFDQMHGDCGGKRPAGGRGRVYLRGPESVG
jgi:hypothetical protein